MAFKVGDRVKCEDVGENFCITAGKVYVVCAAPFRGQLSEMVTVEADDGVDRPYYSHRFSLVEQPASVPTARKNDPATSKGKPRVNKYEQAVLDTLGMYNSALTGREIASEADMPLNCITPRFAPLRRKGLIKDSGVRRDKQIVWVLA